MATGSRRALCGAQLFMRLIQMACAVVVLAIFCYFLATLAGYNYRIGFWVKAVTGVSAAGIFYTFVALLFLCCAPGHPFPSILMILLDLGFLAGFLYVAIVNRGGGGSCVGEVKTAFGRGKADSNVLDQDEDDKTSTLPLSLGLACRLQKACLAVSIIATILYLFSTFVGACLIHQRSKEKRGPLPPTDYSSGSGGQRERIGMFGRKGTGNSAQNPNILPAHTAPDDVRDSFATEQTRVGSSGYGGFGDGAGKYDNVPMTGFPNANGGYPYDTNGGVFR